MGLPISLVHEAYRDGMFWQSAISEPQQLALNDGETGLSLSEVLSDVTAKAIIDNQALAAALKLERGKTMQLTEKLTEAQGQVDTLVQQLAAANVEIARLTALIPSATIAADVDAADQVDSV